MSNDSHVWSNWRPSADLREYLKEIREKDGGGLERGRSVAVLRRLLPPAAREQLKMALTDVQAPKYRRELRRAHAEGRASYLNLGSGPRPVTGWFNIDLAGMGGDVALNLKRGIPLPDRSVDGVFIEHVLEHIPLDDVAGLLDESHRVLKTGGILRVSVPDFRRYAESYVGDGEFLEQMRPGRPTPLLAVHELVHRHGHLSIWDAPTMIAAVSAAGFATVQERKFQDSDLANIPDSELREPESVYVEARKQ